MASYETKHKLFCGNLPPDLSTEELRLVFGTYGNCVDCHVMGGKSTSGQSCAFVVYDTADAAGNAIAALNGVYSFRNDGTPPITVSWARQGGTGGGASGPGRPTSGNEVLTAVAPPSSLLGLSGAGCTPVPTSAAMAMTTQASVVPLLTAAAGGVPHGGAYVGAYTTGAYVPPQPPGPSMVAGVRTKLFVGNLPTDIQQEAIRMVFSHYGTVTNIHIMQGKSRSGQACAFVEYTTPLEAETAILTLHEKYEIRPGEGAIMVKYANSPPRASPY